ncbi:MAG: UDP-3-O-[3-hydroxymyristoyl] N-acetylglucosamine deacetylase [Planctomycetes bacterium]|nr:UDP-3-O-[3-hydroxymyristoyl] N-acetylglucosamine deacetylase [Planctomycetota bacterium]
MPRSQRTIRTAFEITGVGLHTGKTVRMRVIPGPAGNGIVFHRTDVADSPEVPARADSLATSQRRTTLRIGTAEIDTVEHLLACCNALNIDNLHVELDGPEVPGVDGSARVLAEKLMESGVVEQRAERRSFSPAEPVAVRERDNSICAYPQESGLTIQYLGDFRFPGIQSQNYSCKVDSQTFINEIAPARTFCLAEEVDMLLKAGLGKGANAENTVVLNPNETPVFRVPDEPVRHKVLDLIGDLSLVGVDLNAHIVASRSGHSLNQELVKKLVDEMRQREDMGEIKTPSFVDIREIQSVLPHRYPFLLIDRVIERDGYRRAVGLKNVTINEPFFQGHYPGNPIMPGVLILEAMAQLAGVLLLRRLENTGKLAVMWAIDRVKLRGAVFPGDQLRIEVETLRFRENMGSVFGKALVAGKLVAEAQFTFTMREP